MPDRCHLCGSLIETPPGALPGTIEQSGPDYYWILPACLYCVALHEWEQMVMPEDCCGR